MTHASILITGAGIAGPALAYWLNRYGMKTTIVERAEELRTGGQNVDLRGGGREVARLMGLEDEVRARNTTEEGIHFVDEAGRTRASLPATAFGGEGLVAELEILRGELVKLLYERTRDDTEYLFGDRVAGLVERGDKVHVQFLKGPERAFDLVIAADGIRSKARELVFADEAEIKSFGAYVAYFTIPRLGSDGTWSRMLNVPGSRSVLLRPDNQGTTRAFLGFFSRERELDRLEPAEQKARLRRVFADVGWEAPRVLSEMETSPDFYFDTVAQVKMPRWSRGRVALVGDAGYCPSGFTGMGTSLAMVGAYVLAGELARHADHRAAFESYEALLRPYVTRAQSLPPGLPRLANPKTRAGIAIEHALLRVATRPVISRLLGRLVSTSDKSITLPDYSHVGHATSA
jgi:2-polyprenyl-6-methoxyphenol hydroxylase-like FAD-dependent oxidoreductase